jgi:hypothetical protein
MQPAPANQTIAPTLAKRPFARLWFYVSVVILVLSVWGIQNHEFRRRYGQPVVFSGTPDTPTPSDWQKMLTDAMTQANAQATSLGTALLGALGLLIGRARNGSKFRHVWAALLAATGAVLSLYFGYMGHVYILSMIYTHLSDPNDPVYSFLNGAQFYTLLAGAFFFADFAFHDLSGED